MRCIVTIFERDGVRLHNTVHGSGFPVLALAPGGMRSAASWWERAPWNPVAELADRHRVITMDQRNAGVSTAPVTGTEGWATYTADHLALLDHLGIDEFPRVAAGRAGAGGPRGGDPVHRPRRQPGGLRGVVRRLA